MTFMFSYAVVAVIIQLSFGAEIGRETMLMIDLTLACKVGFILVQKNEAVYSLLSSKV